MRVLVVGDFLKSSGMTRYIFNVIGAINSKNIQIDVLSVSGSRECQKMVEQKGWNFNVISPANGSLFSHIFEAYTFFKKYAKRYDVVHFNETALWNFLPILFAYRFGSKHIILNSHNTYFASDGKLVVLKTLEVLHGFGKWLVSKFVWKNIAVSEEAARWMFPRKVIQTHQYKIISNGIKLEDFGYDEKQRLLIRNQLGINTNDILFGSVGVLNKRKNQTKVIRVFNEFLKLNPDAYLVLIGDGPMKQNLIKLVLALGIENKVFFLGIKQNVTAYYQAMDALLMPSFNEGLSTVLIEAQTAGLSIFASAVIPLGNSLPELVHPLKLEATDSIWAQYISNNLSVSKRKSQVNEMRSQGFDLRDATRSVYKMYLEGGVE